MASEDKVVRVDKNIYRRGLHTYQVKLRDGLGGWINETFFDAKSDAAALSKARDFRDLKRVSKNRDPDFQRVANSELHKRSSEITFGQLLKRYKEELDTEKGGSATTLCRIDILQRSELAKVPAARLDGEAIRKWLKGLMKTVNRAGGVREEIGPASDSTKVRYQSLISHVYNTARKAWRMQISNPIESMVKFTNDPGRERRLMRGEHEYIMPALIGRTSRRNNELQLIYLLSLGTACREDETLSHDWADMDWEHHSLYISAKRAKSSMERSVPIFNQEAIDMLKEHWEAKGKPKHGPIFKTSQGSLIQAWKKSLARARRRYEGDCKAKKEKPSTEFLVDLTIHDLRHEATSRLFENPNLKDLEIMAIVGHSSLQTTKRYAHLRTKRMGARIMAGQRSG